MSDDSRQSWWHSVPGVITAVTGLITAVAGLLAVLVQVGVLGSDPPGPSHPATGAPVEGTSSVAALETRLRDVNIELSTGTGDDVTRVRGYMEEPGSAYRILAENSLVALEGRRLRRTGYLDMIDKWYTALVGQQNYLAGPGTLHLEQLREAMIRAENEYHGGNAGSFEEIVAPR